MTELYSSEGIFGNYTYAGIGVSRGIPMSFYAMNNEGLKFKDKPKKDVLVVGAGSGYEVISYIKHGHNVRGIDLFAPEIKMVKDVTYIGSADKMPFGDKEFDFVHCTEMMEHVPEEITNDILMECRRVAKRFYFTIATRDDKPYDTHINIHPAWWWIKRFEELGFGIINAQQAARIALNVKGYASVIFWPDGVFLHGNC